MKTITTELARLKKKKKKEFPDSSPFCLMVAFLDFKSVTTQSPSASVSIAAHFEKKKIKLSQRLNQEMAAS